MIKHNAVHSIRQEIAGVLAFVGVIWLIFVLDWFLPLTEHLALKPRAARGLPGILAMPLLHHDWKHLLSNTFPLIILLTLLAGSRARSWKIVVAIVVGAGMLLWLGGRGERNHLGASGLVFGLIGFLIASGLFERRLIPLLISIFVGFMYGGSLLMGVLPTDSTKSWEGHLFGAIVGVVIAYVLTRPGRMAIEEQASS